MDIAELMMERIREYNALPKEERKRINHKPKKDLRTRMIIKNQRKKLKSK